MRKFRTAFALPLRDLARTAEAAVMLTGYWALVRLVPPRRWRHWFARPVRAAVTPRPDTVPHVRRALQRAGRNMPVKPNCLPQALAARTMLAHRGIGCALHIGAVRDEAGTPRFHAWTIADGQWITGECDDSRFARFPMSLPDRVAPPCEAPGRLPSPSSQ